MRQAFLLLCLVTLIGGAVWAQHVEFTRWQLASDSFPGDLKYMADGTLYVSLNNPQGIASFDPAYGRLRTWVIGKTPGEFVVKSPRILLALPDEGEMAWMRPDVGFFRFWQMPGYSARPVMLLDGGATPSDMEVWYLDWGTGRVGLLAPIESGPADLRDVRPRVSLATPSTFSVAPNVQQVSGELHPGNPNLSPAVYSLNPTVIDPFTEWQLLSPNDPAFGFARSGDGQVWVSAAAGDPLYALTPWSNVVTMHDLPGDPWISSLAAGTFNQIWFLAMPTDVSVWLGLLDSGSGDVRLWPVPHATDTVSLEVIGSEIWFCDRGISAIYRFDQATSTFTWWLTGGDDAPLYLEQGTLGEMWISFERSGAIARMRIP